MTTPTRLCLVEYATKKKKEKKRKEKKRKEKKRKKKGNI